MGTNCRLDISLAATETRCSVDVIGILLGYLLAGFAALPTGACPSQDVSAVHDQGMAQRWLVHRDKPGFAEPFYLVSALKEHVRDDELNGVQVAGQFLLEPTVRPFTGSVFKSADAEKAFVAVEAVQEAVGVTLVERELHDVSRQHRVGGKALVAAVFVGRIQLFAQVAGTGDYPPRPRFPGNRSRGGLLGCWGMTRAC